MKQCNRKHGNNTACFFLLSLKLTFNLSSCIFLSRLWRKAGCFVILEWRTWSWVERTGKAGFLWFDEEEWGSQKSDGGSRQGSSQICLQSLACRLFGCLQGTRWEECLLKNYRLYSTKYYDTSDDTLDNLVYYYFFGVFLP